MGAKQLVVVNLRGIYYHGFSNNDALHLATTFATILYPRYTVQYAR